VPHIGNREKRGCPSDKRETYLMTMKLSRVEMMDLRRLK
jgi:hypothetical protein